MGAKLTKSKSLTISGENKEEQKATNIPVERTNNHLDISTNDDRKQTAKIKKTDGKSKKKLFQTKVDRSTNTDNCVLPLSSFTEQLVGEQMPVVTSYVSSNNTSVQSNVPCPSEGTSSDAQELRDVCFRNGIISTELHNGDQQDSNKYNHQANHLDTVKEAAVVVNGDQVHHHEQQLPD